MKSLKISLLFFLFLNLACSGATSRVEQVQIAPTRTPYPTFTPTVLAPVGQVQEPQADAQAGSAPVEEAEAASIPPTEVPTDTPQSEPTETSIPAEPTNTPEPEPTETPTPEPTNTAAPPPPPPPPPTDTPVPAPAGPAIGQFGVSGQVVARDKTTFAVGEKAFFTYTALNHTDNPVNFGLLGIKGSNGQFNTSWINPDVLIPGVPFSHDDGLAFDVPGTYQVFLAICYSGCGGGSSVWEEYPSGAATITVQ